MANDALTKPAGDGRQACALSGRELEILRLGRGGATDKEIADALDITVASLRAYWTRMRDKLGAVNRTQAIVLSAGAADAPMESANVRERLVLSLSRDRVSTWVWRGRSRQAYLDGVGAGLFGFPETEEPVAAERMLAHVWAPDRARFERFLLQGGELRLLTPIEVRAGVPGDYRNLIRTSNLAADGGPSSTVLLASTVLHVFK